MLLKWLSKFLSGLLVLSLGGLIISAVTSQTIMSSSYLESQMDKVDAYSRLSSALSSEVSKQAGLAGNSQAVALVSSVLTPAALKQKINAALDQLTLYYQGKAAAPSIDLNGFAPQLQATGIQLPADSALSRPIKLTRGGGTNNVAAYPARSFADTRTAAIIASVLLTLALLTVSWQRRRYGALPGVFITVGALTGLGALALSLVPGLFDHYVKFNTASNAFASLGRDLAEDIIRDLGRRYGIIAGVCLAAGTALRIVAASLQPKNPAPESRQMPIGSIN